MTHGGCEAPTFIAITGVIGIEDFDSLAAAAINAAIRVSCCQHCQAKVELCAASS